MTAGNNLSNRIRSVKPSASLSIAARINELLKQGKKVINLAIGEPDFDTPEHIKAAAIKAIQDGATKYTSVEGTKELRQAICDKFQKENSLHFVIDEILVSCGAKQSFYNLCQAVLNPGDEVVIPAPYWISYPEIVKLADGVPVFLKTNLADKFKITPQQLESAITPKTKIFIINSPSNPSGMIYTKEELEELGNILVRHPQVLIASDDIYEHIRWNGGPFVNILNCCPELRERIIIINGVSKTYAMTGWRIGYCAANKKIIEGMKKIQSQSISCPASISQAAALAALQSEQNCVEKMASSYKQRHDFMVKNLAQIKGLKFIPSDGTFYLFVDVSDAMKKLKCDTDVKFVEMFLGNTGISLLPGSIFGIDDHIRISFAASMDKLKAAVTKWGLTPYIDNESF